MLRLEPDDPLARAAVQAIRTGDTPHLADLLDRNPGLANASIADPTHPNIARTLLHVATDYPGHFPAVSATISLLIAHGAEVNAPFIGPHNETPLHWAASADDLDALNVLLDSGADIEAPGSVIGHGTPLSDAVAFGQWNAARRLIARGAQTTIWQAAALGLTDRLEAACNAEPPSTPDLNNAFWCACHGGSQPAAEYLLNRGADLNWIGHDGLTPLEAAQRTGASELSSWLQARGAITAK